MKFESKIDNELMKNIRCEVIRFQLQRNKNVSRLLWTIILICVVIALIIDFSIQYISFSIIAFLFYVLGTYKVQVQIARRKIDKFFESNLHENIQVNYNIDEFIVTTLKYKDNESTSTIKLQSIKTAEYLSQKDLIIYTTGSILISRGKSKPRYLLLRDLDTKSKQSLLKKIKSYSNNFIELK